MYLLSLVDHSLSIYLRCDQQRLFGSSTLTTLRVVATPGHINYMVYDDMSEEHILSVEEDADS